MNVIKKIKIKPLEITKKSQFLIPYFFIFHYFILEPCSLYNIIIILKKSIIWPNGGEWIHLHRPTMRLIPEKSLKIQGQFSHFTPTIHYLIRDIFKSWLIDILHLSAFFPGFFLLGCFVVYFANTSL